MAKQTPKEPIHATAPAGPAEDANAARFLEELQDFCKLGRMVQQRMKQMRREAAVRAVVSETSNVYSRVKPASYFVARYGASDMERLRAIRTKDGTPLSVSHLVQLAKLADEGKRQAWLEKLDRNGWTAQELKAQLEARPDKPQRNRRAGRRMRQPTRMGQGLEQILKWTRDWLKRYDRLWSGEPAPAWQEEAGTSDAEVDRLLAEVTGELARLRRAADRLEERLVGIADRRRQRAGRKGIASDERKGRTRG